MTVAAKLTGVGTFYAYEYDETDVSKFRVGSAGTAFSFEFDENTASTLTGVKMMSAISNGGLIVRDSLNEVDPFSTFDPLTSSLALAVYTDAGYPGGYSILEPIGQQAYTTPGTFNFTVPSYATSISAVAIGAGGGGGGTDGGNGNSRAAGGGGALSYANNISVTAGETLTIVVGAGGNGGANGSNGSTGGDSSISRGASTLLLAKAGQGGGTSTTVNTPGGFNGDGVGDVRWNGGAGGRGSNNSGAGGGGAAGYTGEGGTGGYGPSGSETNATVVANSGGGAGGQYGDTGAFGGGGGGGVGLLASGSVTTGTVNTGLGNGGGAGSGGTNGSNAVNGADSGAAGGAYGGGGGSANDDGAAGGNGAGGAIRIIWGTSGTRSYPSSLVNDQTTFSGGVALTDLTGFIWANNHSLVPRNGTTYSSTKGGIVLFDGVDDYLTTGDSLGLGYAGVVGTGARTSIIWFRIDTPNVAYRLYGWGTTVTGAKWNLSLDATTFKARAEIGGAAVTAGPTEPSVIDGNWHMVATTAPANGTANDIRLYIDGALVTDTVITNGATAINTSNSGLPVTVGASLADASPGYMSGAISSFFIYEEQLTELQIKEHYRLILNRY